MYPCFSSQNIYYTTGQKNIQSLYVLLPWLYDILTTNACLYIRVLFSNIAYNNNNILNSYAEVNIQYLESESLRIKYVNIVIWYIIIDVSHINESSIGWESNQKSI